MIESMIMLKEKERKDSVLLGGFKYGLGSEFCHVLTSVPEF